jgi:acetamidase/formamidase
MDLAVRVTVRRDFSVKAPQFDVPASPQTDASHVCTGVGPDLLEAAAAAVREMIDWLGERHGLEPEEAYAVASVGCDLRIHEVVDAPNWVVGACLPDGILRSAAGAG